MSNDTSNESTGVSQRLGNLIEWGLDRFMEAHQGLLGDYYYHGAEPAYMLGHAGIVLSLWYNDPRWIAGCLALFVLPSFASESEEAEETDEQDGEEAEETDEQDGEEAEE